MNNFIVSSRAALGIVVGLRQEAKLCQGLGRTAVGGGTPAGATEAAAQLLDSGATALLSFGLAGGLDPSLCPGALVIPEAVLIGDQAIPTDARLLGTPNVALLAAHDAVVAYRDAKRRLWEETGAAAVDLESGAVALAAHRRGVPFAVLRAVCDPAECNLPAAALIALNAGGSIVLPRIIASVLRSPSQIGALMALARDAARARRALIRGVRDLRLRGFLVP